MKSIKNITLLLFVSLVCLSCKKFIDIKKNSDQSFLETAKDCQLLLDNYELFNTGYPIDGEISADDYYLDNARYSSDPITLEDRAIYTWQATAIRNSADLWKGPYNKIYHANLIMETVNKLNGQEAAVVLSNLRGSALFFRAYSLWNLAQLYASPYGSTSGQEQGLPIRLMSDINDIQARASVGDTYARIVQDLKEAAVLLNTTSTISSRPNKAAAYAMLARVYLSMGDYPNALTSSSSALALKSNLIDFNTLNPVSFAPFVRFNTEVIFHSTVFSQNAVLAVGYGDEDQAIIDPSVISSFENNDLRKRILFKENTDVSVPSGTYRFTGNHESAVGSSKLFNGLAVDELYLTRAECYARAGNTASAMADLNSLLATRWETGTYVNKTASTASDALAIVLAERRKGLIMRGTRWMDLRRLNLETRFAKTLSRTVNGKTYTLPANDSRYTILIPQEAITNSSLPQNRR
ncbi:RagB/SusD family nutrient uptake outer membrane protein [Pedobacter psychrodurus]|uniref:RagB/SusD family nutrient uptake outer membrane protein n=1 Tax=Pedobacter psychrodurus TaxID=2530456 RepID=A0A4R0PZ54_9SPHI|nr:RagB/SusD family nutrient uptake outer membrane protein [Pedobacter psychrodurus]TCD28520.1 RagB/SusD family nutrient uptake outer membrane protein [Pedobacter psychrodurus]